MSAEPVTTHPLVWRDVETAMERYGVTYRRFDHWINRGFLGPDLQHPGSGYTRLLDVETLRRAAALGALCQIGLTPGPKAADIARRLVKRGRLTVRTPSITAEIQLTLKKIGDDR